MSVWLSLVTKQHGSPPSGRATELKCKLVLAKSPECAHKMELAALVLSELSCKQWNCYKHTHTHTRTYVRRYENGRYYIPASPTGGGDKKLQVGPGMGPPIDGRYSPDVKSHISKQLSACMHYIAWCWQPAALLHTVECQVMDSDYNCKTKRNLNAMCFSV